MLFKLLLLLLLMTSPDDGLTISVERKRELTEAGESYFANNFQESSVMEAKSPLTYNLVFTPRFSRVSTKSLSYKFGDTHASPASTLVRTLSIDSTYYYSLFDLSSTEGVTLYKAKRDELDNATLKRPIVNLDFLWMMGLSAPSSISELPVSVDVQVSDVKEFEREVMVDGESIKVQLTREDDRLELIFRNGDLGSHVTGFQLFRRDQLAIRGEFTNASTKEFTLNGKKYAVPVEFVLWRYAFRDIPLIHDTPIIKDTYAVAACKSGEVDEKTFELTANDSGDTWTGPAFGDEAIRVPASEEKLNSSIEAVSHGFRSDSIFYSVILLTVALVVIGIIAWNYFR